MHDPRKSSRPRVATEKARELQRTTQWAATRPQPPTSRSVLKSKQKTVDDGSDSDSSQNISDGGTRGRTSGSSKYRSCGQKRKRRRRRESTSVDEVEESLPREIDTEEVVEERGSEEEIDARTVNNVDGESTDAVPMTEGQSVS